MTSSRRPLPLARTALPLVVLRALGQALEFLGFVVFARRLGTSSFGVLSVAFLGCRYAGILADWGASLKGTKDVAAVRPAGTIRALQRRRTIMTISLGVSYMIGVLLLGAPELTPLVFCIAQRGMNRDWIALGREQPVRASVPPLLQGCAVVGGSFLVWSLADAAIAVGVAYLAATVLSTALNPLPPGAPTHGRTPVDPWFMIVQMADQLYASADTIMLFLIAGSADAGIYAAVYRFPNSWISIMGLVVIGVLPGITRRVLSDPRGLAHLRRRSLRVGLSAGGILLILAPLAWLVVVAVFGPAYEAGRAPLVILLIATAIKTSTTGLDPIVFAVGDERRLAMWTSGTAVLNIVGNLILIPAFGMVGAASATMVSQMVISGYYLVATRRMVTAGEHLRLA